MFEYAEYIILKEIMNKESIASRNLFSQVKKRIDISDNSIRNKVYSLQKMGLVTIIPGAKPMVISIKNLALVETTLAQVGARLGFERL